MKTTTVGICCLILLSLCSFCKTQDGVLSVNLGSYRTFSVTNEYLLNWNFLMTKRQITIEQLNTNHPFEIYISASFQEMQSHFSPTPPKYDPVFNVDCLEGSNKYAMKSCSFTLSYYGYSNEWWIPRVDYLLTNPPPTQIAIYVKDNSYLGVGGSVNFLINETEDITYFSFVLRVWLISTLLYFFSDYLSKSPRFYLGIWFCIGALLSVITIFIVIIYLGFTLTPKRLVSFTGIISIILAVGVVSFYYQYLYEFIFHPSQHKLWISVALIGGSAAVLYSYTDSLSDEQSKKISLFLRIGCFIAIFFAIPQVESGLLIVILLAFIIFPLISNRIRAYFNRKTYFISKEEYVEEGFNTTKQAVDDLIDFYKYNPENIKKLNQDTQERIKTIINDY